jgi:hypothetical protein
MQRAAATPQLRRQTIKAENVPATEREANEAAGIFIIVTYAQGFQTLPNIQ